MATKDDPYELQRGAAEHDRLSKQLHCGIEAQGYAIHPAVTLPESPKIADLATGSGSWPILLATTYPSATLNGYDISPDSFVQPDALPSNVSLRVHNCKSPFPPEELGTCDFVHIRYIIAAMEPEDWVPLATNAKALLKPGGWLQWIEGVGNGSALRSQDMSGPTSKNGLFETRNLFFDDPDVQRKLNVQARAVERHFKAAGYEDVDIDIVGSDRKPGSARRGLSEAGIAAMLLWARRKAAAGGWVKTVDEVDELARQVERDHDEGYYFRYDIFTVIGRRGVA